MTDLVRISRSQSAETARYSGRTVLPWTIVPFAVALAVAAAVLAIVGVTDEGIHAALLATARWQFLLFWLAYAGGALASLCGPRFLPLSRHAREFGLGFAAALSVHLALVAWLCTIGDVPPVRTFIVFGFAALCVYGLAVFSVARLQQLLGARAWAMLRFLAMNYVVLAFADDFLRDPLAPGARHALLYWPFAALVIAGPALRLAAFASAYHASRKASPV
jgi:hypothetical protein